MGSYIIGTNYIGNDNVINYIIQGYLLYSFKLLRGVGIKIVKKNNIL
jgi:hypothetical protein